MRVYLTPVVVFLMSILPTPSMAEPVRGFVSAGLLHAWCQSGQSLDHEACLSYLRGVFDTLQALSPPAAESSDDAIVTHACIPADAPLNELEIVLHRYATERIGDGGTQGALFVIQALEKAYPCEAASP